MTIKPSDENIYKILMFLSEYNNHGEVKYINTKKEFKDYFNSKFQLSDGKGNIENDIWLEFFFENDDKNIFLYCAENELLEKNFIGFGKTEEELPKGRYKLSRNGEIFIKEYDNSFWKSIDNFLGKYTNISKLFYFLGGILVGFMPTIFNYFTK